MCAFARLKIDLVLCLHSINRSGPNICVSPFHIVLPLHCRATAEAMDKSRRSNAPWANHRREDHKRTRDEFDDVAQDIVAKMKRELSGRLKDDTDRLRRGRNKLQEENHKLHAENVKLRNENARLSSESDRKSTALSQLEQRFKTALEDAFEEVLGAPVSDGAATDRSEEDGAATLPEAANTADGPGEAAPGREEEEGEAAKVQDEALERAAHSTRTEIPEMSQALGGQ